MRKDAAVASNAPRIRYADPIAFRKPFTYTYHPKHLLHEVIQPLARDGLAVKTVFSYYENARGYTQTDGLGQGDLLDYDLFRKSTRVTDSLGRARDYHYDENGRMTKLVEPDGGILLFENQNDAIRNARKAVSRPRVRKALPTSGTPDFLSGQCE
jgi:hypothetical protein